MAKKQEVKEYENYFEETDMDIGLDDGNDLNFNDSKADKRNSKAKSRKNARRRLEDYMETKAYKEKMNEWDNGFDF